MQYKLGFIGVGVMAGAILNCALDHLDTIGLRAEDIVACDKDGQKLLSFAARGVATTESAAEVLACSEIVLFGVKPQFYAEMLRSIDEINAKTLVSIMAGVRIETLQKATGIASVCRVMPNLPCRVGKGISALSFVGVEENHRKIVTAVFASCGKTIEIDESQFDAVTSVSGSGPAYVFIVAAGMIAGGMKGGLTYEQSKQLALATLEGSAMFAAQSDLPLDELVQSVCSKGGTTIEAVEIYRNRGLESLLVDGIDACRMKSELLSRNL